MSTDTLQATPRFIPSPESLMPWDEYQAANANLFPTPESCRWFVRQHRAELTAAGALVYVAGRMFVTPEIFGRVVVEAGQRKAAARVGGQ